MQGSGNKTNEGIRSKRVLLFRFAAFLINYASYFYPDGSSFQPLCGPLHSYLQVNYFVFVVKPFRFKVFNAFDLASSSSFCQFYFRNRAGAACASQRLLHQKTLWSLWYLIIMWIGVSSLHEPTVDYNVYEAVDGMIYFVVVFLQ